jgi:hypothetical protein
MPKSPELTDAQRVAKILEQNRLRQKSFISKDGNRELHNLKRREAYALKKQKLLETLGLAPSPTIVPPAQQQKKKNVLVIEEDNEDEQIEDKEEATQDFKFNKHTNKIDMSHLKKLSPETAIAAFKYLSDKNLLNLNTFKARRTAIRFIVKVTKCENLLDCFNKHLDKIIEQLKTGGKVTTKGVAEYSRSSIIGALDTIGYMIDNFNINVSKANHSKIRDFRDEYKVHSNTERKEKQSQERVPKFQDYENKIQEVFGVNSEMDLITQLYKETHGARDDFGLIIIGTAGEANNYEGDNFIIVPRQRTTNKTIQKINCTVIIDNFKTKANYEGYNLMLSGDLSRKLREYMIANKRDYGDYLFGKDKLSPVINKANSELREKHNFLKEASGGVNLFRKMLASNEEFEKMSVADQVKEAKRFKHTRDVHLQYLRLHILENN